MDISSKNLYPSVLTLQKTQQSAAECGKTLVEVYKAYETTNHLLFVSKSFKNHVEPLTILSLGNGHFLVLRKKVC